MQPLRKLECFQSQQVNNTDSNDEISRLSRRKTAFLTYARQDDRFVAWTKAALEKMGVTILVDFDFIKSGSVPRQIAEAIALSDYQIIFATKAASESEWVQDECEFGKMRGVKQIPIIIDPFEQLEYFTLRYARIYYVPIATLEHEGPAQAAIARELSRIMGLYLPGSGPGLFYEKDQ